MSDCMTWGKVYYDERGGRGEEEESERKERQFI
jgi:hypothetical protein